MQKVFLAVVVFTSMLFSAKAMALDSEIGPTPNLRAQQVICMARCRSSEGCDELTINMLGPQGEVVKTETEEDVPDDGSVLVRYREFKSPLVCICRTVIDSELDRRCVASVAIIDRSERVNAYSHPD